MRLAFKYSVVAASALASVAALGVTLSRPTAADASQPMAPVTVMSAQPAAPVAAAADVVRPQAEVNRDAERTALPVDLEALATRQVALAAQSKQIKARSKAILARIAREKAALERRIRELGYEPGTTDPREIARQMMKNKYGWGESQFQCYDNIIMRESRWLWYADNPTSSAYGIPQALPGSKMASAGADWRTNPATQIKWGLGYVKDRFGSPCSAWAFKRAHGWY